MWFFPGEHWMVSFSFESQVIAHSLEPTTFSITVVLKRAHTVEKWSQRHKIDEFDDGKETEPHKQTE